PARRARGPRRARVELLDRDVLEADLPADELAVVERLDRDPGGVARKRGIAAEQVLDVLSGEIDQLLLDADLDGPAHRVVGVDPEVHVQLDAPRHPDQRHEGADPPGGAGTSGCPRPLCRRHLGETTPATWAGERSHEERASTTCSSR